MKRKIFLFYGVFCYVLFLATFAVLAAFVGNFLLPVTLDGPREGELWLAVVIDLGLVLLFGVQHSVMARPRFKQWLTQYIPHTIERSTYVLASSVCLIVLMLLWRPIGGVIWDVQAPAGRYVLWGLFALGWLAVPMATLLINHFDLFGLRQVWLNFRNQSYSYLPFRTPLVYKFVRHPLYVSFLIGFWATPTMTVTHLLFAAAMTAYILIAIPLEERDLVTYHGEAYEQYRKQVPALIPRPGRTAKATDAVDKATQA